VGINAGEPPKWAALEPLPRRVFRSLGMGGVADLKIHAPPHMFYHNKFESSAAKVYA